MRNTGISFCGWVSIVLWMGGNAVAQEVPVRLTDTLTIEYRTDNENGGDDDN